MIEETRDAVGDTMAVAVRLCVDELIGRRGITADGEGREVVEMLAELPDLWDVNLSDVSEDSKSARFSEEGYQEPFTAFVKSLTSKPVVGVGRYTSPDRMAGLIRRGVLDFIGAARPSIADPFLPRKVEQGRVDEIRECIGCNICRSGNNESTPIRCTQNPTMGEEWRRGWHPENMPGKRSDAHVLVVGGGPAGMECARALGQRGYQVTLAEADTTLGGRINGECRLPGLSTWARVRDWRAGRLHQMGNVDVYFDSRLDVADVREVDADYIVCATGSRWRRDGLGANTPFGIDGLQSQTVFTPDDLVSDGKQPSGTVVVYDDDNYYMAGVIAERLAREGAAVTYITPQPLVSAWTQMTNEQHFIQARLLELGVEVVCNRVVSESTAGGVRTKCVFGDTFHERDCDSLVLVTARSSDDALYQQLLDGGVTNVSRIGDCEVPGAIVHAVYSGHRYARELQESVNSDMPFRRERVLP